jgi:DNA-directed RNA polymerase subunit RPC12/RpoP
MSDEYYQFSCPHCQGVILVHHRELNCRIFRHGIDRVTMQQMNPHAPKEECDRLAESNQIMGCGKPFQVVEKDGELSTIICDYI